MRRLPDNLAALLLLLAAVAALEVSVRTGWIDPFSFSAPSVMVAKLVELARNGELWPPMVQTGRVILISIVLSCLCGFSAGLVVHALPRLRRALDPLLSSYFAVPVFVFYPLLVVLLGLGDAPLVAVGSAFSTLAVMTSTLVALDRFGKVYGATARVMRLGPLETIIRVKVPAMTPYLIGGLKLSVAYATIGVVGGEFILAPEGIGHRIAYAYNNFDNATMYALMLLLVSVGLVVNMSLHLIERRVRMRLER